MKISICIPTYEMNGQGIFMLRRNLDMIKLQTFKDFEIVISDNSKNNEVEDLCTKDPTYSSLPIKYIRNPKIGMAPNTNEAMKNATGEIIKILFMDDYFADEKSLERIIENFKGHWLVTGCAHNNGNGVINPHFPRYNKKIIFGKNTIGSPSILSIKNENILFFDENMTWVLDCDYYARLYEKFGEPTILNEINIIIGTGSHQVTRKLSNFKKIKEHFYIAFKHISSLLFKL